MAKYLLINVDAMSPVGVFGTLKEADEVADASDAEDTHILKEAAELKAYSVKELVTLHNSVSDSPVKSLGKKDDAQAKAFDAMIAFDYENGTPQAKEGEAGKPGRKSEQRALENGIVKLRKEGGWTRNSDKSLRGRMKAELIEFMGRKQSVKAVDFRDSLEDEALKKAFLPTMRHLMLCGHIIVEVEKEDDLVEWVTPLYQLRDKMEERAAKKAAAEEAKAKAKKAKKKATKKDA